MKSSFVLAVSTALLLVGIKPTLAVTQPEIFCLNGWGARQPSVWCDPDFEGTLLPMDLARGYGEMGILHVRGVSSPGTSVQILVSDGSLSLAAQVVSSSNADSGTSMPAGAFEADFHATDLGIHAATAGVLPDDPNADNYGKSAISVTAVAIDHATGSPSFPYSTRVAKYAATFSDWFEPTDVNPINYPPPNWCHANVSIACSPNPCPGSQSVQQQFVPKQDPIPYDSIPAAGPLLRTGVGIVRNVLFLPGNQIYTDVCSPGEAVISGRVSDLDPFASPSASAASEIADVRLTITRGAATIVQRSILAARPTGTSAIWSYKMKIKDFAPNPSPTDPAYIARVDITDAWGNATLLNYSFRVYPW